MDGTELLYSNCGRVIPAHVILSCHRVLTDGHVMYEVPYSKYYLNCWVCGYYSSADEHCSLMDMTPFTVVDWYIGTKVLNELAVYVFGGIREDALL